MQTTEAPCPNNCTHCGGPIAAGDQIPLDPRSQMLVWRHVDCLASSTAVSAQRDNGDLVAQAMGLIPPAATPLARAHALQAAQTMDNGDKVAAAMGLKLPATGSQS